MREVPARFDGQKLYLKTDPDQPEVAYDWPGGSVGAHHATITESQQTRPYLTEFSKEVVIYDAAGAVLGQLEFQWTD